MAGNCRLQSCGLLALVLRACALQRSTHGSDVIVDITEAGNLEPSVRRGARTENKPRPRTWNLPGAFWRRLVLGHINMIRVLR